MKRLFTALFAFVLLVLGTPALLATIMYDGSGDEHMPTHLYTEDADAQQMLMEELRDSFDELESGATEDMIFNLHEDIINVAIFNAIREENPDYMPTDDCVTPEECYVVAEQQEFEDFNIMLRVVGAWVKFEQDTFNLNVFLEVELEDGFTYKTIVSTEFKFTDVPGKYVLEFEELRIGNLPLPASALSGLLNAIETNAEDVDFDSLTSDVEVGEVDLAEFSYTIQKDEIVELIGEDQPSAENDLIKEVVSIIFEQELLTFEFVEEEFVVSGRLSKFKSEDVTDIPEYLYDLHEVDEVTGEVGEFDPTALDPETYLADLFTEYVFNNALIGDSGFNITEEVFNKLIYSQAEGFVESRTIEELDLGNGDVEEIEIGLKGIWFEITPDAIYANALIRVASVDSNLVIRADKVVSESSDTELVFEFTEITFGADELETVNEYLQIIDLEAFKQMFAELGDINIGEFDENGTLYISADRLSELMQDGSQEDTVNVTGISIIQGAIVLDIEPADPVLAQALEDFSAALQDVIESEQLLTDLEALLDTNTEGPEQDVFDAVSDLQETLANEETPSAEQVAELFDNLEELDSETQEEFLETISDLIDPSVLEQYEDLFEQTQE
mgnify:FL=1